MPFARPLNRREIFFGSLRFRLTLWYTSVVILMVVFTLSGVREGLRFILWREADKELIDDAKEMQLTYEQNYPDKETIEAAINRKALTHTHRGLHMRIFDADRNLLWTSKDNAPPRPFPTSYIDYGLKPVTAGHHPEHYRLVHIETRSVVGPRVGDRPAASRGSSTAGGADESSWPRNVTIRIGASLQPLEEDVAVVTGPLILAGIAAVFISPLGGFWLAGRATRPIAQIIDTTKRLRPTSLSQRLPLRGTRDELDRLSATINGFLDRIAAYLQQNRDFTASAAHELRSPLAALQSSLEVALNSDRSVEEYKEILVDLLGECEDLRVLVNQLLVLAESDAGEFVGDARPVAFDQIVQRAFDMFLGVAESAEVGFRLMGLDSVWVDGDAGRLRQVVNNLMDNAIKYTRPGGLVSISLHSQPDDGAVCFTIQDTGMGIPAADLPHIFDRFFRGDKSRQRDHRTRGLGLGLAICHSIVTAHRGRIEVESVVDRGTTFTVILPAASETDLPASSPDAECLREQAGQAVVSRAP